LKVARSVQELKRLRRDWTVVGFVPTMGALHEGHLELVRVARRTCSRVVVSIFVNPTQFGPGEDFDHYPRSEASDLDMLDSEGVDLAFLPQSSEMYGVHPTLVHVPFVTERFEGAVRPGHFDGVATVVLKLFNLVRPTTALFGWKDMQQCSVLAKMVRDLDLNVELSFIETVREPSGLALSSRNRYLTEDQREQAAHLYHTLVRASQELSGRREEVTKCLQEAQTFLTDAGFEIDYACYVDPWTMMDLSEYVSGGRVAAAVRFHGVRLLDNVPTK